MSHPSVVMLAALFPCLLQVAAQRDTSPGCPLGDLNRQNCWNIRRHSCYQLSVKSLCCRTCEKFPKTSIPGCEYGDYYSLWNTKFGKYRCDGYTQVFGFSKCNERFFARKCCEACSRRQENRK